MYESFVSRLIALTICFLLIALFIASLIANWSFMHMIGPIVLVAFLIGILILAVLALIHYGVNIRGLFIKKKVLSDNPQRLVYHEDNRVQIHEYTSSQLPQLTSPSKNDVTVEAEESNEITPLFVRGTPPRNNLN